MFIFFVLKFYFVNYSKFDIDIYFLNSNHLTYTIRHTGNKMHLKIPRNTKNNNYL